MRSAAKAKPTKHKMEKHHVQAPLTGATNDPMSNGGTTEPAKAAKTATM